MSVEVMIGDCRAVLPTLPAKSVNMILTSPPYYGLRDYGTGAWIGGDPECPHKGRPKVGEKSTLRGNGHGGTKLVSKYNLAISGDPQRKFCRKCGAERMDNQVGLEETPAEYITKLVEIFRECRRVLRDDGTLWINIGDSYAAGGRGGGGGFMAERKDGAWKSQSGVTGWRRPPDGLKRKDMIGIPFMLAFALRDDGWFLRQDIIWSKPNPQPENVKDRFTKSHEYLFLFSKRQKYWFDQAAVMEPCSPNTHARYAKNGAGAIPDEVAPDRNIAEPGNKIKNNLSFDRTMKVMTAHRNKRSVWTVSTAASGEKHFATFPPDLIIPAIKAGCPKGGVVLDPFGGVGTTGLVCDRINRNAILVELNPDYAEKAEARVGRDRAKFPMLDGMAA